MRRLLALFTVLGAITVARPTVARASAVIGCRYEGRVVSVDNGGKASEAALKLEITAAKGFGHSAGPAVCASLGTELKVTVENGDEVRRDKIEAGSHVKVEEVSVFNQRPRGKSHSTRYTGKATPPPAPTDKGPTPDAGSAK